MLKQKLGKSTLASIYQHLHSRLYNINIKLDISKHAILQSIPTHWNSVYAMLERAVEKSILALYAIEHEEIQDNLPSNDQWQLTEYLITTLKRFQEITLDISKANATISFIILFVSVLKLPLSCNDHHSLRI